jgi:phospholipase/carboxylesterase
VSDSIVVQQPLEPARQLVLLFHGFGARPEDLLPLAHRLATALPQAWIVSIRAPAPTRFGFGYQWFAAEAVNDADRAEHVAAAMPGFRAEIEQWQQRSGIAPEATAIIGFSQGAIMCLEQTRQGQGLAARVIALAGRYATLPTQAPEQTTLHFIHGKQDEVVHYRNTIEAAERLIALGGDVTADVIPFVGHEINDEIAALAVERLTGYVPRRLWEEALREDGVSGETMKPADDD